MTGYQGEVLGALGGLAKQQYALDHRPTLRERLKAELAAIDKRAADIAEALDLLDRNPDFEKLQNLI